MISTCFFHVNGRLSTLNFNNEKVDESSGRRDDCSYLNDIDIFSFLNERLSFLNFTKSTSRAVGELTRRRLNDTGISFDWKMIWSSRSLSRSRQSIEIDCEWNSGQETRNQMSTMGRLFVALLR